MRRAVAEVAELRSRLDNAADDYADGTLDREQFHRITERLRPRLEAAQARARVVDSTPLLAGLIGAEDVRRVWEGLPSPPSTDLELASGILPFSDELV